MNDIDVIARLARSEQHALARALAAESELNRLRGEIATLVSAIDRLFEVIAEPNSIVQDMGIDNAMQALADALAPFKTAKETACG